MTKTQAEPWLRGTHEEIDAVPRAVIHAMELAEEDLLRWCGDLTEEELRARPHNLPAISYQIRHLARSTDRLLTYAEGRQLDAQQLQELGAESEEHGSREEIFSELSRALAKSIARVRTLGANPDTLKERRAVGRMQLPSTTGGLLMHVAEHTQRHVGQAITTAKVFLAQRGA